MSVGVKSVRKKPAIFGRKKRRRRKRDVTNTKSIVANPRHTRKRGRKTLGSSRLCLKDGPSSDSVVSIPYQKFNPKPYEATFILDANE